MESTSPMGHGLIATGMVPDPVEVIFFDVGGTLAWGEPSADVIWSQALEEHGHHLPPEEVVRRTGVHGPEVNRPDLIRAIQSARRSFQALPFPRDLEEQEVYFRKVDEAVLELLGLPVEEEVLDTVTRRLQEDVVSHVYEDAVPALQRLREAGFRLGVISNATHDLPGGLEELELARYFEVVTYSYEVGAEKPDPHIFRTALARLGVQAGRAAHVGDSYEADVVGARGAGLLAFLIRREDEGSHPDCVVLRSLGEIVDHLDG